MKAISQMVITFPEEMVIKGDLWFLIARISDRRNKRDKEREIDGKDILKIQGNVLVIFENFENIN